METRTRSGRVSKPPARYEPVEIPVDDYATDDYDTGDDGDDIDSVQEDSDEEFSDESDADDDGNLDGFVVADKSESDEESSEETDGPPPLVSVVKKRPVGKP